MFADDAELYNSAPRSITDSLFCNPQNCVSDVNKWTIHRKLHLNEDKTEALLFDLCKSVDRPVVLKVGQSNISLCNSARNLGVMFGSGLFMKYQVDRICQTAYFEIRMIGAICQLHTIEGQKLLPCLSYVYNLSFRLL